jgi:small GTP-binding protein
MMARSAEHLDDVPGVRLRHTLSGHEGWIGRMAWSPKGNILATPSQDRTVRLWDAVTAQPLAILKRHTDDANCVAWSPDGKFLASGADDSKVVVWNSRTHKTVMQSVQEPDDSTVWDLAWSPDGSLIAAALLMDGVRLLNRANDRWSTEGLKGVGDCRKVAWSHDGNLLALAGDELLVLRSGNWTQKFRIKEPVPFVSWSPRGNLLVTSSSDRSSIYIWDAATGMKLREIAGHLTNLYSAHFSSDGRFLASKGEDYVQIWRCDTWEPVAIIPEDRGTCVLPTLAFHPFSPVLATFDDYDSAVRIWDLDYDLLLGNPPKTRAMHYTTAKVALVGNSGVGKTGLGWRLAHGKFKEHESTHGQQFWVIPELGITRADGVECEAVLWDLAGQPDYRLIHTLFLDDVDLALLLFDASNREDPLQGVEYWLKHLAHAAKERSVAILVGARIDRGTPNLTGTEIAAFCNAKGIEGGYVLTSAARGLGIKELMERIKAHVRWTHLQQRSRPAPSSGSRSTCWH